MTIAIQGVQGCYHHLAACKYFGQEIHPLPCLSFKELIEKTEQQQDCQAGIMAIENSIAGSISSNYYLLSKARLTIVDQIRLKIEHHLLALQGQCLDEIEEIYSHYMAIKQCLPFLKQLKNVKIIETEDTALSAKWIAETGRKKAAAIAGNLCADLYGLNSLQTNIAATSNNYTRFLILKRK